MLSLEAPLLPGARPEYVDHGILPNGQIAQPLEQPQVLVDHLNIGNDIIGLLVLKAPTFDDSVQHLIEYSICIVERDDLENN